MKTLHFLKCFGVILVINVLILLYLLQRSILRDKAMVGKFLPRLARDTFQSEDLLIDDNLTIVIREFEDFENYLPQTISSIRKLLPTIKIIVASASPPYPPVDLNFSGDSQLNFVELAVRPNKPHPLKTMKGLLTTFYTMFLPDGANLTSVDNLLLMLKNFHARKFIHALATKVGDEELSCPEMDINLRSWTIKFHSFLGYEGMCDYIQGDQAMLIRTDTLFELPNPFERPFYISLYMQMILRKMKSAIYKSNVFNPRKRFTNFRSDWKYKKNEEEHLEVLMNRFGIKYVRYDDKRLQNFGCRKDTERCFGTVINDMPDYIYKGRWTPPCCLDAIRMTARHVFKLFEKCSVRYWLEGGSLLGAARYKDIIPWDYDVDIGIYKVDINKSDHLRQLMKKASFRDEEGYLWERAIEGEFFRVHYSDVNRNHIDIFPFYEKLGVMTKNTWFKTHKQDTEFPEHFLKPLTKIEFAGINVSAPNNVKKFLEYKFGVGVIENPKYPNNKNVQWFNL